jgi:hypothetical protein
MRPAAETIIQMARTEYESWMTAMGRTEYESWKTVGLFVERCSGFNHRHRIGCW